MRKNIEAVCEAFYSGRAHSEKTCSTDGRSIYSYGMRIASRFDGTITPPNVTSGLPVLILDRRHAPSNTTRSQIDSVVSFFGRKGTIKLVSPSEFF